jgi:hypothetical protein
MSADPSVAFPSYVEDGALNEPRLQSLADFVITTLSLEPDPENARSHFLLLLSSSWAGAFPKKPNNQETKPSESKEHKKRKPADNNIVQNMNDKRMRMVVSYTGDQQGKDIRDEDVVRPKNKCWAEHGGEEAKSWKQQSRAGCPTYGSCQQCMRSGPVGMFCNACYEPESQPGYVVLVNGDKILDSITLANILNQGHEIAKADRYFTPFMVNEESFGNTNMQLAASRVYGNIKEPEIKERQILAARHLFYDMMK